MGTPSCPSGSRSSPRAVDAARKLRRAGAQDSAHAAARKTREEAGTRRYASPGRPRSHRPSPQLQRRPSAGAAPSRRATCQSLSSLKMGRSAQGPDVGRMLRGSAARHGAHEHGQRHTHTRPAWSMRRLWKLFRLECGRASRRASPGRLCRTPESRGDLGVGYHHTIARPRELRARAVHNQLRAAQLRVHLLGRPQPARDLLGEADNAGRPPRAPPRPERISSGLTLARRALPGRPAATRGTH